MARFMLNMDPAQSTPVQDTAPATNEQTQIPVQNIPAEPVYAPVNAAPVAYGSSNVNESSMTEKPVFTGTPSRRSKAAQEEKTSDPYATAFPSWDLLPPQVLIRRIVRKK